MTESVLSKCKLLPAKNDRALLSLQPTSNPSGKSTGIPKGAELEPDQAGTRLHLIHPVDECTDERTPSLSLSPSPQIASGFPKRDRLETIAFACSHACLCCRNGDATAIGEESLIVLSCCSWWWWCCYCHLVGFILCVFPFFSLVVRLAFIAPAVSLSFRVGFSSCCRFWEAVAFRE